jgi:hypothetical protein
LQKSFLLNASNPTLGIVRLRLATSSYQGEHVWHDSGQHTSVLPNLLVDTLSQRRLDVEVVGTVFQASPWTETVELQSAEDSIMELGGKAREIPKKVVDWEASKVVTGLDEKEAKVSLVAHSASDAWFELVIPDPTAFLTSNPGIPIQLQVELGNGSWESSLIQQTTSDGEGMDWVNFDLLLTWS